MADPEGLCSDLVCSSASRAQLSLAVSSGAIQKSSSTPTGACLNMRVIISVCKTRTSSSQYRWAWKTFEFQDAAVWAK
jgi:hypothetical protein